ILLASRGPSTYGFRALGLRPRPGMTSISGAWIPTDRVRGGQRVEPGQFRSVSQPRNDLASDDFDLIHSIPIGDEDQLLDPSRELSAQLGDALVDRPEDR